MTWKPTDLRAPKSSPWQLSSSICWGKDLRCFWNNNLLRPRDNLWFVCSAWAHSTWLAYYDLLGLGGNRVQLLQWMISLTSGTSWERGAGTILRPGIIGFKGVIPAIMPRFGSKSGGRRERRMRVMEKNSYTATFKHRLVFHKITFGRVSLQPIVSCCAPIPRVILPSTRVTRKQPTHNGIHIHSWINHLVNNMHILRSF